MMSLQGRQSVGRSAWIRGLRGCWCREGLAILLTLILPAELTAQVGGRRSIKFAAGVGWTDGSTTYRGSAAYSFRLGVGYRVVKRVVVEGSVEGTGGIGQSDVSCVGRVECPANFTLVGGLVTVLLDWVDIQPSRLLAGLGVGWYRVKAQEIPGQPDASRTALGIHGTLAVSILRWNHGRVGVGARVVVLPSVDGERLWWFTPLEVHTAFW